MGGGRARESETETERGTGYTYKMYQVRHPWMNVSACEWMWLCLTQVRLRVLSGTVILKEYVLLSFLPSYPVIPLKCPLISSFTPHTSHRHTDVHALSPNWGRGGWILHRHHCRHHLRITWTNCLLAFNCSWNRQNWMAVVQCKDPQRGLVYTVHGLHLYNLMQPSTTALQ